MEIAMKKNRLNVSRNPATYLVFAVLFLAMCCFTSSETNLLLPRISLFSAIVFAFISFQHRDEVLSPYYLFMLFSFIYNFGELWLRCFGVKLEDSSFSYIYQNKEDVIYGFFYVLLFLILVNFFKTVFEKQTVIRRSEKQKDGPYFYRLIEIIALPLLILSLLYDYQMIVASLNGGYGNALSVRSQSAFLTFANESFIFCSLYLMSKKKAVIGGINILLLLSKSLILMFVVGTRMLPMAIIVCVLLSCFKNRKINVGYVVLLAIVGSFLLNIASFAYDNRLGQGDISSIALNAVTQSFSKIIYEMGQTFVDVPLIIKNIDSIGYAYGKTYMYGALAMIPKISIIIPDILAYSSFSTTLNTFFAKGSGLGGSLCAELFYNFGWFSILTAPFISLILLGINRLYVSDDCAKNTFGIYLSMIVFQYVRGTAVDVLDFLRVALLFFMLCLFLKKKRFFQR